MNSSSPDVKTKENEQTRNWNPRDEKSLREQKNLRGLTLCKRMEEWEQPKSNSEYEIGWGNK